MKIYGYREEAAGRIGVDIHTISYNLSVAKGVISHEVLDVLFYFAEYPVACHGDVRPAKQGEISPKIKDFGRKGASRTLRSSNMKRSEIFERSRVRYSASKNEPQDSSKKRYPAVLLQGGSFGAKGILRVLDQIRDLLSKARSEKGASWNKMKAAAKSLRQIWQLSGISPVPYEKVDDLLRKSRISVFSIEVYKNREYFNGVNHRLIPLGWCLWSTDGGQTVRLSKLETVADALSNTILHGIATKDKAMNVKGAENDSLAREAIEKIKRHRFVRRPRDMTEVGLDEDPFEDFDCTIGPFAPFNMSSIWQTIQATTGYEYLVVLIGLLMIGAVVLLIIKKSHSQKKERGPGRNVVGSNVVRLARRKARQVMSYINQGRSSAGTYGCPQAYVKGDTLYRWLKNVPIFAASFGLIVIILGPLGLLSHQLSAISGQIGPATLFSSMLFLIGGIKVTDDEYRWTHDNVIVSFDYPPISSQDRLSLHEVKRLEKWLLEIFRKTDSQAELQPLKFGRFAIIYKLLLGGEDFALSFPLSIEKSHVAAVAHDARCFKRYWESGRRRFIPEPHGERTFGLGITKGDQWMSFPIVVSEFLRGHEELNFAQGVLRRWESDRESGVSRFIPLPKEDIPPVLAEMAAAIVYHYEPDKDGGTTMAGVFVNSGDFVLKRNSRDPPRIRITTIRRTKSGVDIPAFIQSLVRLYTIEPIIPDGMMTRPAAFVKPRCAQVPVCISNPSVAFHGLIRGLRYLAEDLGKDPKKGEQMAEEWIRQFAESPDGKPYRPQAERFLKGDLPLTFGNDPLEGRPSLDILQSAIDELYEKRREATFRNRDEVRSYDQAIQLAQERMAAIRSFQDKDQGPSMTSESGNTLFGISPADLPSLLFTLAGLLGFSLLAVFAGGSRKKNNPRARVGAKKKGSNEKSNIESILRESKFDNTDQLDWTLAVKAITQINENIGRDLKLNKFIYRAMRLRKISIEKIIKRGLKLKDTECATHHFAYEPGHAVAASGSFMKSIDFIPVRTDFYCVLIEAERAEIPSEAVTYDQGIEIDIACDIPRKWIKRVFVYSRTTCSFKDITQIGCQSSRRIKPEDENDAPLGIYLLADPLNPIVLLVGLLGFGLLAVFAGGSRKENNPRARAEAEKEHWAIHDVSSKDAPEELEDYLKDESRTQGGHAARAFLPRTPEEVAAILKEANRLGIPASIRGGGTGLVAAAVPFGGWVISMEKMNEIIDIRKEGDEYRMVVMAGARLGDIHKAAESEGLFYPPNPTERTATLGGNINTDAFGTRGFKYGSTRKWVTRLKVVLANGEILDIKRGETFASAKGEFLIELSNGERIELQISEIKRPNVEDNSAGYFLEPSMDLIDLFIGAEGTLGVVTEVELKLIEAPTSSLNGLIFYETRKEALDFVKALRNKAKAINIRAIDYLDGSALDVVRDQYVQLIPAWANCAILIEQEFF
ncbi:MAG: FAD-binding oxidoreductase, partial [Candidatus Omnitrophota bacterium]